MSCFSRLISSKRQRSYNLNFRLLEPMIDFKIVSKYEMRNNKVGSELKKKNTFHIQILRIWLAPLIGRLLIDNFQSRLNMVMQPFTARI